jgi:hypothetical protein
MSSGEVEGAAGLMAPDGLADGADERRDDAFRAGGAACTRGLDGTAGGLIGGGVDLGGLGAGAGGGTEARGLAAGGGAEGGAGGFDTGAGAGAGAWPGTRRTVEHLGQRIMPPGGVASGSCKMVAHEGHFT